MEKTKNITKKVLCFLLVFLILFEIFIAVIAINSKAAETTDIYTDVLYDLKKDDGFNPSYYPEKNNDYSVKIIQVAEGVNGELFVYVYRPCLSTSDLKVRYINMSLKQKKQIESTETNASYSLYSLTLVDSQGVFEKYIVNGFSVKKDPYRYYNIAAIYRDFDKDFDSSSVSVDGYNCKGFKVGQLWCAYYYNGELVYEMETVETVETTIHASGSIRYSEGFKLYVDRCDSHYVAFSVDNYDVDQIFDADVTFTQRSKSYSFSVGGGESITYGDPVTKTIFLSSKDTASNNGDGILGKKYTWNRIQTVSEFMEEAQDDANHNFSSEELEGLDKSEFVFRFTETDYTLSSGYMSTTEKSTEVYNAGILRLHFVSKGKVYNLGCVSDLVSIDDQPELNVTLVDNVINTIEEQIDLLSSIAIILLLVLLVVILILLWGPLTSLFKVIWNGLVFVFNVIVFIVSFPFTFLSSLFGKRKKE